MRTRDLDRPFTLQALPALVLLACCCASAGPTAESPTTRPRQHELLVSSRATELGARAVRLMRQGSVDEAETLLREAVAVDPNHPVNLYNLACALSLRGRGDEAAACLRRAAAAGFGDFAVMERDPDLEAARRSPAYRQLMAARDDFQRLAAARAVEALRRRFGEGYLCEVDADEKLVFATNVDRQTLDALRRSLQRQARSQWDRLFEHRPTEFILVVVPSPGDYKRIVPLGGIAGYYDPARRTLIARQLGQVMAHEFTHALHAADAAAVGQRHPIWLTEGLASLYEATEVAADGNTLEPRDNFRLSLLQSAARRGRLVPLEKLLALDRRSFVRLNHLAYGQSGSLLMYLDERGLLRKFYDAFKQGYDQDPTGREALERVTGVGLERLERDWVQWMVRRRPPPLRPGLNGLLLGARFVAANDGLKVAAVVPLTPAQKAGVKSGDVLVGIDGQEVRDMQTLAPLLDSYRPGDVLALRMRRGGRYVDVAVTLEARETARSRWLARRAKETAAEKDDKRKP